ncbi:MAG: CRTAC1 family protein [Planctomycetota bacterium JB042]
MTSLRARASAAVVVAVTAASCGSERAPDGGEGEAAAPAAPVTMRFAERREGSGVGFVDAHGREGRAKRHLPESMGGGVGLIDHDADGDLDLFLAGGDRWTDGERGDAQSSRLYRNDGAFRYRDVSDETGASVRRDATAVAVGDVDADGFDDLFVAAHGPNVLLRNRGDGAFEDRSRDAGVDDDRYAAAAAFGDFDGDGDLDLYVGNYFVWDEAAVRLSEEGGSFRGHPVMAGPRGFVGAPDVLYANRSADSGDLRFDDVTEAAGLSGSRSFALGAVVCDLDDDGDVDLYVANDSEPNALFVNDGAMRFEERALPAGAALSAVGQAQAGMGIVAQDLDGDERADLFLTNFSHDTNTFYRNLGDLRFEDVTRRAGLATLSYLPLGFGVVAVDADLDGDHDLAVANGHVFPSMDVHPANSRYAQPDQLLENLGDGRLREVDAPFGPSRAPAVSRGLAHGDLDGDGREDLVITTLNGSPSLLRNETEGGRCVVVRLVGTASHPNAIGARVEADLDGPAGARRLVRRVVGGGSYMSASSRDLVFGLGARATVRSLRVRWPSGAVQSVSSPPPGHLVVVTEGVETPALAPLRRRAPE